jgi:Na+-transporting methylmalonyl-CoA/oxaloacetate decarboxylase gamma subunit
MSSVSLALQITAAGMGVVFAAILLLLALMELLVRLTAERRPEAARADPEAEEAVRRQAAAAAVAVAMSSPPEKAVARFPLPPTAFVSAWQAVRRSSQLNQRGPVR